MSETTAPIRELTITGMDCADCALTLERGVARLEGVELCQVNFTAGTMRIEGPADAAAIESRIRSLGYGVADPDAAPVSRPTDRIPPTGLRGLIAFMLARRETALALVGIGLLLISLALSLAAEAGLALPAVSVIVPLLHGIAILLAGVPIMVKGWRSLLAAHEITINLLMSIATVGAVIIGETGEAATVIALFAIGEALEGYSAERARYSLRALLDLVPPQATVLRPCLDCAEHLGQDGYEGGPCPFCAPHEIRVPVEELGIGETVLVAPGERIPMDGTVLSGESAVNQAPITGESLPVDKAPGDPVFAGAINGHGALEVEITRLAADNTLSRIVRLVQEAQSQRAPTQRLVDRFARWYTPAVVVVALGVALVPPVLFGAPFWNLADGTHGWLYRALTLLIIACPCALVISTPVTIVSALTQAARRGVLIKGGAPLEALARVRAFAFDKTGTLTQGRPVLTNCRAVDCTGADSCPACEDLLALAAAVERRSEHPLAQAVVSAAAGQALLERYPAAHRVASLTGRGVQGEVGGRAVTVGNHLLFDAEYPHPEDLCLAVQDLEAHGQTTMLVADERRVRGVLAVADEIRPASQAALIALHALRPQPHTVMLTGDNETVARAVGAEVGVDDVRAGLLPEDKLATIERLNAAYGSVAMVGDGINDAPALAAATVGIAMGGSGTPQAMETADMVLMQDDLRRLPEAIQLSRRALALIRQNVGLSLGIKLAVLLLTLPGWAGLWLAVFADVGASLIVTANGMRLLRSRSDSATLQVEAGPHTGREPPRMSPSTSDTEREIWEFLDRHLTAIFSRDWDAYAATTSPELALYEWWVIPHRQDGLDFHLFMIENAWAGASENWRYDLLEKRCQLFGDTAILSYTFMLSQATEDGITHRTHNESRVIVHGPEGWRVVHVHKSPATP